MSKIEWTDATWNPVVGCTRVSEGCRNCYAERMAATRLVKTPAYAGVAEMTKAGPRWTGKLNLLEDRLEQPLRWRKPRRVFVNSMSDLFHEAIPFEFIAAVFAVMAVADQHVFQVLTKRPRRAIEWFRWLGLNAAETGRLSGGGSLKMWKCHVAVLCAEQYGLELAGCRVNWPLPNIWLGVSVEDQKTAAERIPLLLETPAAVRFISLEPMLGPVDLQLACPPCDGCNTSGNVYECFPGTGCLGRRFLWPDWVIVGGESGPNARPMDADWARYVRDQCAAARVPYFFKQMSKKSAIPADLRVREYPA